MSTKVDVIDLPGELGSRSGCESFELAVDIASAGALDAVASAQLERHLATCTSCCSYRDRSGKASAILASSSAAVQLSSPRLQAIEARLMRLSSSPWPWFKNLWMIALSAFLFALIPFGIAGMPAAGLVFFPVLFTALFMLPMYLGYRRVKRAMKVHDVMVVHRREVERTAKSLRVLPLFYLPIIAMQVQSWLLHHDWFSLVFGALLVLLMLRAFKTMRAHARQMLVLS